MDGREPQFHEVWDFGSDSVTREVQLTAGVDVDAGIVVEFSSNYLNESGRRTPLFGNFSNNRSVENLGIPDFNISGGTFWADNILATGPIWGEGGTTTNQSWGIQYGEPYESVVVSWIRPIPVMTEYVCRSPENICAAARRVCDDHL